MSIRSKRSAALWTPGRLIGGFDPNGQFGNVGVWISALDPDGSGVPPADSTAFTTLKNKANVVNRDLTGGSVTYTSNAFGSAPGLRFPANVTMATPQFSYGPSWSVYAVAKFDATGAHGMVDMDSSVRIAQVRWNGTTLEGIGFHSNQSDLVTANITGGTETAANVVSAIRTSTTFQTFLNGVGSTVGTSPSAASGSNIVRLNAASGVWQTAGYYGDVLMFTTDHDSTTRQMIERQLGAAYNITVA